jgi:hypothetical protein
LKAANIIENKTMFNKIILCEIFLRKLTLDVKREFVVTSLDDVHVIGVVVVVVVVIL